MPEHTRRQLNLPAQPFRLEEANLPAEIARSMAGLSVEVRILPEELPGARPAEPDEFAVLIDPDGNRWNDYWPLRVIFADAQGNSWQLPRRWLEGTVSSAEKEPDSSYAVEQPVAFAENLHLPSFWDLLEVNIPNEEAARAAGQLTTVSVCLAPREPVKVIWYDSRGTPWRIPYTWRRRRVRLPARDVLIGQGVPVGTAKEFSNRVVSVNYHPGSLCCLPDQYRFRDTAGIRYPVYIKDCILMGYGDTDEFVA